MSGALKNLPASGRRHARPVLLLALLVSAALHAGAGSLLFAHWQRKPIEMPGHLTVMLHLAPPSLIANKPVPPTTHKQMKKEVDAHSAPAPPSYRTQTLMPPIGGSAEAALSVVAPAPETAAVTASIAKKVPDVVSAPSRADVVVPPQLDVAYLNCPSPDYPPLAHRLGLEGRVVVRVRVSSVRNSEPLAVVRSSGASLLDDAALKAVVGCIYKPPRRGDAPFTYVVDVPFNFRRN